MSYPSLTWILLSGVPDSSVEFCRKWPSGVHPANTDCQSLPEAAVRHTLPQHRLKDFQPDLVRHHFWCRPRPKMEFYDMLEVCGDEDAAHEFLAQNNLLRTVAPGMEKVY